MTKVPEHLPYKPSKGRARGKTAAQKAIAARRVEMPDLFVAVGKGAFGAAKYVRAHFRVRREKYRYLVWRDGSRIREFYLGKLESGALRAGSDRDVAPARRPRRRRARA
jgi:hypothetical protein